MKVHIHTLLVLAILFLYAPDLSHGQPCTRRVNKLPCRDGTECVGSKCLKSCKDRCRVSCGKKLAFDHPEDRKCFRIDDSGEKFESNCSCPMGPSTGRDCILKSTGSEVIFNIDWSGVTVLEFDGAVIGNMFRAEGKIDNSKICSLQGGLVRIEEVAISNSKFEKIVTTESFQFGRPRAVFNNNSVLYFQTPQFLACCDAPIEGNKFDVFDVGEIIVVSRGIFKNNVIRNLRFTPNQTTATNLIDIRSDSAFDSNKVIKFTKPQGPSLFQCNIGGAIGANTCKRSSAPDGESVNATQFFVTQPELGCTRFISSFNQETSGKSCQYNLVA